MSTPRAIRLASVRKPKKPSPRVRLDDGILKVVTNELARSARIGQRKLNQARTLIDPLNQPAVDETAKALPQLHPVKLVPVQDLKLAVRNARTHPKKQKRQLTNAIQRWGFTAPIVADEHGRILAGHLRFEVAKDLGFTTVPVIVISGLNETEKRALALADNQIQANGGWDRAILATELADLSELLPKLGLDLSITGFETAQVDSLISDFADPAHDPADNIPLLQPIAVSRPGDFWVLNRHRLFCGNALEGSSFDTLMKSKLAALIITDPPFNLRIRTVQGRGKIKHREFVQGSGELSPIQFDRFLETALSHAASYSVDGSLHFVFQDWRHADVILAVGKRVYSELKNIIVWAKSNGGQGSLYRSQHELIFLFKNGDAPHINNVELGKHGRNRSNVWSYTGVNSFRAGRMDELSAHPTAKPVAMIADALLDCSHRNNIILDPFMGSGTTIIAAERVGRRAYGLELDPLFVDVAIRRWQAFTKRDAILRSTGQTFGEVAELRAGRIKLRR